MTDHDKAGEARRGLIDSVKGKAKEVFGAVTRNDSMAAEGQLEQRQAEQRREAASIETVADAEAEQAQSQATRARLEGAAERTEVNAAKAAEEKDIRAQEAEQKREAERSATDDLVSEDIEAERQARYETAHANSKERAEANVAEHEVKGALGDHQDAVRQAAHARAEADRLRERAEGLEKGNE